MTASKSTTRKPTTRKGPKADLSALFAKPVTGGSGSDDPRKWLADVPAAGIAEALRPIVSGTVTESDGEAVIGMVRAMVGNAVTAAAEALAAFDVGGAKVSLSTKGNGKVTANVSVPFSVDGSARFLNVSATVDGMAGQILATYAQRKA